MMDKVAAFEARKVRIYLCPAGTIAMADPEIDFILCAGK